MLMIIPKEKLFLIRNSFRVLNGRVQPAQTPQGLAEVVAVRVPRFRDSSRGLQGGRGPGGTGNLSRGTIGCK